MNEKSLFKDKIKIKAAKNLMVPFLIVTIFSGTLVTGSAIIDAKQEKQIKSLEKVLHPSEDQAKEYRAEIKKYFASYMNSPEAKQEIIQKTSMESYIYDELEKNGFENMLTDEDIDEIMNLAIQQISREISQENDVSAQESTLYSTLYNKLLYKVRDNLINNDAFTVTQTVTYDTEQILKDARYQISSIQTRLAADAKQDAKNLLDKQISVTDVRDAYVAEIVDKELESFVLSDTDKAILKDKVFKELSLYFESEEGKALIKSGKDGKDGKPIDWTDEEILNLITKAQEELILAIKDNGDLNITGVDGASIDLQQTFTSASVSKNNIGPNVVIQLSWTRGDWDDNRESEKINFEVQSFNGMTFESNQTPNVRSMIQSLMTLSDEETNGQFTTEGGKVTFTRGRVTQLFEIATLVDAFAQTYLTSIYTQINNQPIGSVKTQETNGVNKYYCTVMDNGTECGQELQVTSNDTEELYYTCPTHDIVAVSIKELFRQSNDTLTEAQQLASVAIRDYGFDNYTDNSQSFDTMDKAVESTTNYMLDMYTEILNEMDKNHNPEGKSVFDYYCKNLQNVNNELETAPNHYGFSQVMDTECLNARDTESVIVRHMMHEGYINRNTDGNLEFILPVSFDAQTATDTQIVLAKLENAYASPLIQIIENYIAFSNSEEENGMLGLLTQWSENLDNIMTLIDLIKGSGYVIPVAENSTGIIELTLRNRELEDLINSYLSDLGTDIINLKYAKIKSLTGDIKADLVSDRDYGKIDSIYYNKNTSKIYIALKDKEKISADFELKVWF